MAERIVSGLNFTGTETINFTEYLGHIRSSMMSKGHKEQLRFCFNLFDLDGNGFICPNDMDKFNMQYTGICSLLSTDYLALANMFTFKQAHYPNYQMHLRRLPAQVTNSQATNKSKRIGSNSPSKVSPNMKMSSKRNLIVRPKRSRLDVDS